MKQDRLYVVRKYVFAKNTKEAILKEKKQCPDDVWLDEDWKRNNMPQMNNEGSIGFKDSNK